MRTIWIPTELGESNAPIERMIARKVATHELHVFRLEEGGHTGDSGQSGCSGKRNSDELCPAGQTESSHDVKNDKKADVGPAEDCSLPNDSHHDPSYHICGTDREVP